MQRFSSIEGFGSVYQTVKFNCTTEQPGHPLPTMTFVGTTKLHGSNSGIRKNTDNTYTAQSRNRDLCIGNDQHGLAAWLALIPTADLDALFAQFWGVEEITIFGEWVGPGIQRGVAVNQLPTKHFVIVGAYNHAAEQYYDIPRHVKLPKYNIYNILDAGQTIIEIDMNDPHAADEILTRTTLQVEKRCPYGHIFGINGTGEGLVWKWIGNPCKSSLWFKTKGEKHRNRKDKTVAPVDTVKVENVNQCVDYILNDVRLQQGLDYLNEMNLPIEMSSTGEYLKWVGTDCKKEDLVVIERNDLEWKDVSKEVNRRARDYFREKTKPF